MHAPTISHCILPPPQLELLSGGQTLLISFSPYFPCLWVKGCYRSPESPTPMDYQIPTVSIFMGGERYIKIQRLQSSHTQPTDSFVFSLQNFVTLLNLTTYSSFTQSPPFLFFSSALFSHLLSLVGLQWSLTFIDSGWNTDVQDFSNSKKDVFPEKLSVQAFLLH